MAAISAAAGKVMIHAITMLVATFHLTAETLPAAWMTTMPTILITRYRLMGITTFDPTAASGSAEAASSD
jgi:hypothetical protein